MTTQRTRVEGEAQAASTNNQTDLDDNRLLNTKQAAALTPYTPHALENMRSAGRGPAFIKVHGGAVAYRLVDLLAWQANHRVSTLDQK